MFAAILLDAIQRSGQQAVIGLVDTWISHQKNIALGEAQAAAVRAEYDFQVAEHERIVHAGTASRISSNAHPGATAS